MIIGNAYASEEELKAMGEVDRYQTEFAVEFVSDITDVEKQIVLNEQHYRRGDITDQMVRSTLSAKNTDKKPIHRMTTKLSSSQVIL